MDRILLIIFALLFLLLIFLFSFKQNFTGYFAEIKKESNYYVIGKVEISNGKIVFLNRKD
ncbi:MAG: hypothetical protein QW403_03400 [Candidatus Aenigmatarchaeota archaeon]